MAPTPGDPAAAASSGASGARQFGRYVLLSELGAGGMGVVFAARDPQLDRRVAIKVLRREAIAEGGKPDEHTVRLDRAGRPRDLVRERLLAEGRAMARLSHPNLVALYEVGEVDGQLFLAMECIEGITLGAWCRAGRRSWRDILRGFCQAGRGLAAAHAAGLVHGDFKPSNALVDGSGRVRVIDLGVARAVGTPQVGRLLGGTPSFAAPELLRGLPADPRADQFAFAVALYRQLYRCWPFPRPAPGRDPLARFEGGARPAPRGRAPRWVERAIRRSLSPEPADRYPSMEELLAALEADRSSGPVAFARRAGVAGATAAVIVLAASVLPLGGEAESSSSQLCRGERVAGAWGEAARGKLRASLLSSGRPHAARTAELVAARLDDYASAWRLAHQEVCDATFARGVASLELFARRMACLDRRLEQLGVAAQTLIQRGDGPATDNAIAIADSIEPVADCARGDPARAPLPADPTARAAVTRLDSEVRRASAELQAGRADRAVAAAAEVMARARHIDYPSLFAEASWVLGQALEQLSRPEEANRALLEALRLAERARDGELATRVLIDLARVVGVSLKRMAEADRLIGVAEAGLERVDLPNRERMRALLLQSKGSIALADGRPADAERAFREMLELARSRSRSGSDPPWICDAESRLATALEGVGRYAEARRHHRRAVEVCEKNFGPEHPRVAAVLNNLGSSHLRQGENDEARRHYRRSLSIVERIPHHMDYARVLNNLGALESNTGHLDEARRLHEAALAEREQTVGPDHADVAGSLSNLAKVFGVAGDPRRALPLVRRALDIRRKRLGEDHPLYGKTLAAIAAYLCDLGRWREARDHAERAAAIIRARLGPDHGDLADALIAAGNASIELGQPRAAIADLERAFAIRLEGRAFRAEAGFALARALWDSGTNQGRALELARDARDAFAEGGRSWERSLREAERWLRRRDRARRDRRE